MSDLKEIIFTLLWDRKKIYNVAIYRWEGVGCLLQAPAQGVNILILFLVALLMCFLNYKHP